MYTYKYKLTLAKKTKAFPTYQFEQIDIKTESNPLELFEEELKEIKNKRGYNNYIIIGTYLIKKVKTTVDIEPIDK
jgi:hypothetical protein